MNKPRILLLFIIALGASLAAPGFVRADAEQVWRDVSRIFNQYSRHLDDATWGAGWYYSVPSSQYGEVDESSEGNLRMQTTFAAAYAYRNDPTADQHTYEAIVSVLGPEARPVNSVLVNGKRVSTRGFGHMIGMYLALQIFDARADLFTEKEQHTILSNIRAMYPWALKGKDTENRALIGAAYAATILYHPRLGFSAGERANYEKSIREKVAVGLRSIDAKNMYREGKKREFSLHYHLVSAHMLAVLGRALDDGAYTVRAEKMFRYVHDRYPRGQLTWRGSNRPRGIGLQTVLLRALAERDLGNPEWWRYWEIERKARGFIDQENHDRLVWRDEVDKTLNDDYSFMSMAWLLKR